jgi:hypothetical protein
MSSPGTGAEGSECRSMTQGSRMTVSVTTGDRSRHTMAGRDRERSVAIDKIVDDETQR